jgi:hypothetical protein
MVECSIFAGIAMIDIGTENEQVPSYFDVAHYGCFDKWGLFLLI